MREIGRRLSKLERDHEEVCRWTDEQLDRLSDEDVEAFLALPIHKDRFGRDEFHLAAFTAEQAQFAEAMIAKIEGLDL